MTVRGSFQVHFGEADVSHQHAAAYSTFEIADRTMQVYLHFENPVQIDKVIAELVALRAAMTAEGAEPSGMQSPRPVVRVIEPDLCECGHLNADHHFNGIADKYADCNVCDIGACDAFRSAAPAQAAS